MVRYLFILGLISLISCTKNSTPTPEGSLYFPPLTVEGWETTTPESLNWNIPEIENLYTYLSQHKTRAFILLKGGKIVLEKYWGNDVLNANSFSKTSSWYWASAGKSLTSFLIGIAQQDGLIDINNRTSQYLGDNWSSEPLTKEYLITIKNQLTMTTGLDYGVSDIDCTDATCLTYKADAGAQWYYHNAPYTLLEKIISTTSGKSYNQYTDEKIEVKIGMNGTWLPSGYNNVYWSTARDAARFGLLILNKGNWNNQPILTDANYFNAMTSTSQNLNPSYGYLWWLNGKSAIVYPGSPNKYPISLAPDAPNDLFAAMGKNGQFIDVVPSQNLVVIRMGEAPDNSLVPITFHNDMWKKILTITQ